MFSTAVGRRTNLKERWWLKKNTHVRELNLGEGCAPTLQYKTPPVAVFTAVHQIIYSIYRALYLVSFQTRLSMPPYLYPTLWHSCEFNLLPVQPAKAETEQNETSHSSSIFNLHVWPIFKSYVLLRSHKRSSENTPWANTKPFMITTKKCSLNITLCCLELNRGATSCTMPCQERQKDRLLTPKQKAWIFQP